LANALSRTVKIRQLTRGHGFKLIKPNWGNNARTFSLG